MIYFKVSKKLIYPILKGVSTLSIISPPIIIVVAPLIDIKKPIAAAVPIDFLISYPKVLMKGTIRDPPPIPRGTEIKPIITPEIFLIISDIFFGFFQF